jgi:putative ABC transport system permease protein
MGWLKQILSRRRRYDELAESIREHLEEKIEDLMEEGLTREEATHRARREFGNVTLIEERSREVWQWHRTETLLRDLRFGARMLLKNPGFSLIVIAILALGIGANTAIFSVANAFLLQPLPYKESDRLVTLWHKYPKLNMPQATVSPPAFIDYRDRNHVFEDMTAMTRYHADLIGQGEPERLQCLVTSVNFFRTLGIEAAYGRTFLPEDEGPDRSPVVILSNESWLQRFGADPGVIGRTITLDGKSFTIIGVMPRGINLLGKYDLISPLIFSSDMRSEKQRKVEYLTVIGRLKPGVSLQQARAEFDTIANQYRQKHYRRYDPSEWGITLVQLYDQLVGKIRPSILILQAATVLVLLIACANVANLFLARAISRQRELAVRLALGATRLHLIRQLLTESVLAAVIAGALGLLLAVSGSKLIVSNLLPIVPQQFSLMDLDTLRVGVNVNSWVLVFTLISSLLTGMLCGLVPALQASRQNLSNTIKEGGGQSASSSKHHRARGLLVISEIALAIILLIGAGLLIKSFLRLQEVNPGFNAENKLAMSLSLPRRAYNQPTQISAFYEQLLHQISNLPGVRSVGAVSHLPMSGSDSSAHVGLEGVNGAAHSQIREASPDYFRVMEIPLLKGRTFEARDTSDNNPVVIIDETMAKTFFPNDPIGKRLNHRSPREIVGVVGNVKHSGLDAKSKAQIYIPLSQDPANSFFLVVHTSSDPLQMLPAIRSEVRQIDKNIPIYNVMTLDQVLDNSAARQRGIMYLMAALAGLALLLALLGIYGLISYSVAQRTHELGVRIALGATPLDLLRMVVKQGVILALAGVVVGVAISVALTRFISDLLFGVNPVDPAIFLAVSLLFVGVAVLASYLPARRAIRIDPILALRHE